MFKQFNGSTFYRRMVKNEVLLPDATNLLVTLRDKEIDQWTEDEFTGPVLDIDQLDNRGETIFRLVFQLNNGGVWNLIRVWDTNKQYISAEFDDTHVYEFYDYKSRNVKSSYKLKFSRNLDQVSLSNLFVNGSRYVQPEVTKAPSAYSQTPIYIPYSQEFIPDNSVYFDANKRYAVYSGPSETSLRGANGRAVVSTNDWIQVFGREGDWVLVNYGIGKDHYRFGYIKAASLPKGYNARTLTWMDQPAVITASTIVTDDPLYSQSELTKIEAGTNVLWLGTLDNSWAYIEYDNFRGFVTLSALGVAGNQQ
jgi:hypothetical protein